jgi:hypothetical protein
MVLPTRFTGRKILVVLATVVLLAACDGDSEPNATDTTPPGTDATGELAAKLLTAGDLPPGWSEAAEESDPGVSDQESGFCGEPVPDEENATGSAVAQFAKGEATNPSRLVEAVVAYETPEEATEAFSKVEQTVGTCKEWDLDEAGTVSRFKLASATFPNIGDQTVAVRITSDFKTAGGSGNNPAAVTGFVVGDVVVVRQGNHIVVLRHFAIGLGQQPDFTGADTEPSARRAVEKVMQAA